MVVWVWITYFRGIISNNGTMAIRIAGRIIMIKKLVVIIVPLLLLIAVNVIAVEQRVIMDIEGMTCAL